MRWSQLDCHYTKRPRARTATVRDFFELVLTPAPLKKGLYINAVQYWERELKSRGKGKPGKKHFCGAVSPNLPTKDKLRSKIKGSGACFIGFDFDHLRDEYRDRNCGTLAGNGILAVARTTTSHGKKAQPGESRCRFMVPLSRPLTDWVEYDRLLAWGEEFLVGEPDPACEHAASLFYLPLKGTAETNEWCWVGLEGEPLDVDFALGMHPIGKKSEQDRAKKYMRGEFVPTTAEEHLKYWDECTELKQDFLIEEAVRYLEANNVMWAILKPEGGNGRHDQAVAVLRIGNDLGIPYELWHVIVLCSDWNAEQRYPLTEEYLMSRNLETVYKSCKVTFGSEGDRIWKAEKIKTRWFGGEL